MSEKSRVLIVDDEEAIRNSLSLLLQDVFAVEVAADSEEALNTLKSFSPDLVILDLMLPDVDGIETLREMKKQSQNIPVIVLSGNNTARIAVDALKRGASDYVVKPFDIEDLRLRIQRALESQEQNTQASPFTKKASSSHNNTSRPKTTLVGESVAVKELQSTIDRVADGDATVLVTGESGTGKELIARTIHERSKRSHGPFIAVNCAAIPETLVESELFGHEKGAFTHAVEKRVGQFALADGGTLFLDEIGELSVTVQVKLLRFLQEQEFYPVGQSTPERVNVRVVTATNQYLPELIRDGRFREDLYYRIHVIHLEVPPLRERKGDVSLLVSHFLKSFFTAYGSRELEFSEKAMKLLSEYQWPGNVRELENVIESLMALAPEGEIDVKDLPIRIQEQGSGEAVFAGEENLDRATERFQQEMIVSVLQKLDGDIQEAASVLGFSKKELGDRMKKLGIEKSDLEAQQ